jgi:hypothetical protein
MSCGTRSPARPQATITPAAESSLVAKIAVGRGSRASRSAPAAIPFEREQAIGLCHHQRWVQFPDRGQEPGAAAIAGACSGGLIPPQPAVAKFHRRRATSAPAAASSIATQGDRPSSLLGAMRA